MKARERRGLLLAFGVFGVFWGAWSATLPALRLQVGASDGELGLALAAIAVAAVPVMPVAGRMVDRFGARRMLPASLLVFALAVPMPALAHSLTGLVLAAALLGVATGALDLVANAATAAWERIEQDAAMSVVHGSFSVGVLVGASTAGLARDAGGTPRLIFPVVAVLVLVVGLTQPAYRTAERDAERSLRRRLPRVLVGIGLLVALAFLCEDAIQSWSALHLERGLGASPGVSGLGPGLFAGAMAVGRFAGGPLSRRHSPRRMLAVASAVLALGAFVVAAAPNAGTALAGLVVAGLGTSVLAPVLYSVVGSRAAQGRQGADLAAVSVLGYVGFVAGPPLVGAVSAASSLPTAIACLGGLGLVLAVTGPLLLSGKMRA